jgi:polysaccharide transporter, PST family
LLSAGWMIIVARGLTLEQFGEVSVALALVIVLTALTDFGLQFMLARDVVDTGVVRRPVLDAVIGRRFVLSIASALVMVPLYVVGSHDRNIVTPLVFSLSIVGGGIYNPTITGYRATGKIGLEVVSEIGSRAVVLVAGGLWVLAGGGVMAVAVSYSAAGMAVGVVDYLIVRSRSVVDFPGRPLPSLSLRASAPFALATTVGAVYARIDNYLVSLLRGAAAAGIYGASYRFQDINLLLPSAMGQLALAEAAGQDPRARLSTGKRVAAQSVLMALGPALFFAVFAEPLLSFLFGHRYAVAAPIVIVLMVSTVPGAAAIGLQGLTAVTDPRRFAAATAGALAVNVAANLVLIPPFAGLGAAWANVVSQTFLAGAYYWALWRKTGELRGEAMT